MQETEIFKIPFNKKKLIKITLFLLLFFLGGILATIYPPTFDRLVISKIFGALVVKICYYLITIGSTALFGYFIIQRFFKITRNEIGFAIDKQGFIDYSAEVKVGLVLWKDVVEIIYDPMGIYVYVRNPEEYIAKQKSTFKQDMMKHHLEKSETFIIIRAEGLDYDLEKIAALINNKYLEFKNSL